MCNLLCFFGCLSCVGCRGPISRKLVFFPPPCAYTFEKTNEKTTMCLLDYTGRKFMPYTAPLFEQVELKTKKGGTIVAIYIGQPESRFTILFSHGNATDLGGMRDHLIDISARLKTSVFAYDYSGYGMSSGKPSVGHVYADIEAAYQYLVSSKGIDTSRIIAYGQSLGTAPSAYLASRHKVAGVILHSPLMSGIRVIRPVERTYWFDIFPTVDIISQVMAPILIIHGVNDQEVPVHHGANLYQKSSQQYAPWFVEGAGHNDIEVEFRPEYLQRLKLFLDFLDSPQGSSVE